MNKIRKEEIKMDKIKNATVNIVETNTVEFTNEMLDIFCQQLDDSIICGIKTFMSVNTHVYLKKYLVFEIHALSFLHLKALNSVDYEIKYFIQQNKEDVKRLFGDEIEGITLNVKNHNWDLIFNEYYNFKEINNIR